MPYLVFVIDGSSFSTCVFSLAPEDDWDTANGGDPYLYLAFPRERKYVEIYVSAIADMSHFWIQTIGPMALQLDRLSQQMTCFYENEGQVSLHDCT